MPSRPRTRSRTRSSSDPDALIGGGTAQRGHHGASASQDPPDRGRLGPARTAHCSLPPESGANPVGRPGGREGMNVLEFTAVVFAGALAAGFLGALTGLGGGIVVIPLLTLLLGVDIRYAAGAALVSVIATSSGAASAYVREGWSNLRVGMFLEVATSVGAVAGALAAAWISGAAIAVIFGAVLLLSAALSLRSSPDPAGAAHPDPLATRLRLDGTYPTLAGERQPYHVQGVPAAFGLMLVAGGLSGLLGIGSGAVKVLALDRAMRL